MTICRLWQGRSLRTSAAAYLAYLTSDLFPALRANPGFQGYHVLTRNAMEATGSGLTDFITLAWFDSLEDVKRFAGDDYGKAVIGEKAAMLLKDYRMTAEHYELATVDLPSHKPPFWHSKDEKPLLRDPHPGDLGWVVHRHGALYAEEYGWDMRFEAIVAGIATAFLQSPHAARERCWIAEVHGRIVGSVLLTRKTDEIGQLRLLYVEPGMRGAGLGTRLVQACIDHARLAGYKGLELWTNSVLLAARHLYQRFGFRIVGSEPHRRFGPELLGETWMLEL